MEFIDARSFVADRAWGSRHLLDAGDFTARIHWTDQPYRWHANRGGELFLVLSGAVDLHYLDGGRERVRRLGEGGLAVIAEGEHHLACPVGEARILVIERVDSERPTEKAPAHRIAGGGICASTG